jgi:glycosyltransferase involved in cell wall biosynthesis
MKFVFASYVKSSGFDRPEDWINRIYAYLGVLESLGKQHTVISIEQINYTGSCQEKGVQYFFMDFGKRVIRFPWKLHRFIKKVSPDIILIHGMDFPLQVIQLRLMMGSRVRIIAQSHGNKMPKGYQKILQRIADRCIDAYFFTSRQMGEPWLTEKLIVAEKKMHEVMVGSSVFYPADQQTARNKMGISGHPVFLWVGRLDENKDPLTVVRAFLRYNAVYAEAKLYMIYQTDELLQEVKDLLEKNVFKTSVILIGKVLHADMQHWFNSADFFIAGSHFEVFGAAVSEAMSCGCIPVVTNIPSFQKITGNAACGLLYKAGDEESLVTALQQTAKMHILEERKKVLRHFEQHLSFDAIARKIQEVAVSL